MRLRAAGLLILAASSAALADDIINPDLTPKLKGEAIALERSRRDEGFGDSVAEVRMRLTDEDGRVRQRSLTWKTLEANAATEGDWTLTVFHEPSDIAGTALLSHTHIERPDDQWLYFPAIKRVKRIASGNRSGFFAGSDFAYEDLLSDEFQKFSYLWLRNANCGDQECYVVERRPTYEGTGYERQIVWIDQAEFRPQRIDYYDLSGRLEKTLVFEDYRRYRDQYWRASVLRMRNPQSGSETTLEFLTIRLQTGLTELDFDVSALRRIR